VATDQDLTNELRAYCSYYSVKPALRVSKAWEIVKGMTSGGSVPDYDSPGCYALYSPDGTLQYIGKASRLGNRLGSYWTRKGEPRYKMAAEYSTLQTIKVGSRVEARDLEAHLIAVLKPPANKRKEKRPP
jgi:hypothetical protein